MEYPPSSSRSTKHYKIAHLHYAVREIINHKSTKMKWTFIKMNGISDDFVGNVGYMNLEPNDTIKEKAQKFVCIFNFRLCL